MENKTRPSHYGGEKNPHEPIKVIEHYNLNFCLGNVIKYTLRAGKKGGEDNLDDLRKAAFYLNREIENLEMEQLANKSPIEEALKTI